jgi:hypothetical protein
MQYSLGNMLKGGGAINPDGLALDLQFAADKTLTARTGPTPVFTRANATATFIGSNGLIQTAGINVARFDHDPTTLACKGLLIEEQRTNLVFPSDALTTQTVTVTAVAHTLSFYGTGTVVLSGTHTATVTGTAAYPTRTTLTFTPTAGSLILTVTGSVTQAQLEAGSFATSYIPTVAASAVRSADVCSITGSNFTSFYNQSEGTFSCVSIKPSTNLNSFIFHASDGSFANGIDLRYSTSILAQSIINASNVSQVAFFNASITASAQTKQCLGYKANDCAYSVNSATVLVDTVVTIPTVDRMTIGNSGTGSLYINGTISSIQYYKKRLPDAKLQSLTA